MRECGSFLFSHRHLLCVILHITLQEEWMLEYTDTRYKLYEFRWRIRYVQNVCESILNGMSLHDYALAVWPTFIILLIPWRQHDVIEGKMFCIHELGERKSLNFAWQCSSFYWLIQEQTIVIIKCKSMQRSLEKSILYHRSKWSSLTSAMTSEVWEHIDHIIFQFKGVQSD